MTQTIEQLQSKVAELEEEIERLKSAIPVHTKKESECDTKDDWRQKAMYYESRWSECSYGFNKVAGELRAQLAAAQEENGRLENQVLARDAELWGRTQEILGLKDQLAKAEQRVAEACALQVATETRFHWLDAARVAKEIRSGEWKRYLK